MKKIIALITFLAVGAFAALPNAALPPNYISGCNLKWQSSVTFDVGLTNVVNYVRMNVAYPNMTNILTNYWDTYSTNPRGVRITNTGTGGVDTNTALTTNAGYGVYAVYLLDYARSNGNTNSLATMSLNFGNSLVTWNLAQNGTNGNGSRNLYKTYDAMRYVGSVPIYSPDGAGAFLLAPFTQSGSGRSRTTMFSLSNRYTSVAPNTGTNTTYTFVNLTNFLPPTATHVYIAYQIANPGNTANLSFKTVGADAEDAPTIPISMTTNLLGTLSGGGVMRVPVVDRGTQYKVNAATTVATLNVIGWDEDLF